MHCHRSSTSSQQVITFLHGLQTHLFVCSSCPLSSYGTSLPRLAPNLHLHADTALTTKQGVGSVTCTGASAITHPALLSCALLFFNTSLSSCSTVSPWTSYSWYQLGTRTWPGDSLKMPLPRRLSMCRLTRLKRKCN